MGACEHSGWVDLSFHSTQALQSRPVVEPVTSPAGALVEVGVVDAGRPLQECLLNDLHVGVNLRGRGSVRGDSQGKHQKAGLQMTDRAGIDRTLGNSTT